jgi:transposase
MRLQATLETLAEIFDANSDWAAGYLAPRPRFLDVAHHAFSVRAMLDRVDEADQMIARLNRQIEAQVAPFRRGLILLDGTPGISTRVAEVILAEIGADVSRFPTAGALTVGLRRGIDRVGSSQVQPAPFRRLRTSSGLAPMPFS